MIAVEDEPPVPKEGAKKRIKTTNVTTTNNEPRAQWKRWADRNNPALKTIDDEYPRAQWKTLANHDINNNSPSVKTPIPETITQANVFTPVKNVCEIMPPPKFPKPMPQIRSIIQVSIPLEKLGKSKEDFDIAKSALQEVEKRIEDVDMDIRINKAAIEKMKGDMNDMDTQIDTCRELQRDMPNLVGDNDDLKDDVTAPCTAETAIPLGNQAVRNQGGDAEWELEDVLNLTDETVKSWMPLEGWEA